MVSCADRIVWVRVEGNGSSTNSTALRDFAKEMIHRGAREFFVDLCNCPVMDSTFMGTLAGISLWLGELGEGCLSVVNLNERNAESLCSLGLDQLFNVRVSAIKKDGQALPIPLEEDRTALIAEAAARAGLPPTHPHMLRHSCGFSLANRGYDLRLIQDYLGHRDPKHTVHYTRVAAGRFEGLWR